MQYAGVAELADAQASGACYGNIVRVQVPPPARKSPEFSEWEFRTFFLRSRALSNLVQSCKIQKVYFLDKLLDCGSTDAMLA